MQRAWHEAELGSGEVHQRLIDYVSEVESEQWDIYDRFIKCAALYDPHDRAARSGWWEKGGAPWSGPDGQVYENVCASNVDTVAAIIAPNKPRARFVTDDGEWSTQKTARQLEAYAAGLVKLCDVHRKTQVGFKDAAKKGTGLVKVYEDGRGIKVERVPVDEIVVDEGECTSGQSPRQMTQRKIVDRTTLKRKFPKHAEQIEKAGAAGTITGTSRLWADYRPIEENQVVVLESWYLPFGEDPEDEDREVFA